MEYNAAIGLGEAIVVAFNDIGVVLTMLILLAVPALYAYLYFTGKTKDKKYSEEMEDSKYTLRYYKKDIAQYIAIAVEFIALSIMFPIMFYITVEDRSFGIGVLALYIMSLACGIPGIVSAIISIQKSKWKVVVSENVFTVHKLFHKPKEIRFSDIVAVGKKRYHSANRGYGGVSVLCYVVYVRSLKSYKEKAFEVHELVNGFNKFEVHLNTVEISAQGERRKSKTALNLVVIFLFVVPSILISFICITNNLGIFAFILSSAFCITSFFLVKYFLSDVYVNKEGVHRRLFIFRYISIPWDSCVEIGIGNGSGVMYDCIYFSKIALTNEQINRIGAVKQNREHLWCLCDDLLLTEVLQYVDRDKIKNLDLYESIVCE